MFIPCKLGFLLVVATTLFVHHCANGFALSTSSLIGPQKPLKTVGTKPLSISKKPTPAHDEEREQKLEEIKQRVARILALRAAKIGVMAQAALLDQNKDIVGDLERQPEPEESLKKPDLLMPLNEKKPELMPESSQPLKSLEEEIQQKQKMLDELKKEELAQQVKKEEELEKKQQKLAALKAELAQQVEAERQKHESITYGLETKDDEVQVGIWNPFLKNEITKLEEEINNLQSEVKMAPKPLKSEVKVESEKEEVKSEENEEKPSALSLLITPLKPEVIDETEKVETKKEQSNAKELIDKEAEKVAELVAEKLTEKDASQTVPKDTENKIESADKVAVKQIEPIAPEPMDKVAEKVAELVAEKLAEKETSQTVPKDAENKIESADKVAESPPEMSPPLIPLQQPTGFNLGAEVAEILAATQNNHDSYEEIEVVVKRKKGKHPKEVKEPEREEDKPEPVAVPNDDDDLDFDLLADISLEDEAEKSNKMNACNDGEFLPNPNDCNKFSFCFEGELMEMNCNMGLYWDMVYQICDESSQNCYKLD